MLPLLNRSSDNNTLLLRYNNSSDDYFFNRRRKTHAGRPNRGKNAALSEELTKFDFVECTSVKWPSLI